METPNDNHTENTQEKFSEDVVHTTHSGKHPANRSVGSTSEPLQNGQAEMQNNQTVDVTAILTHEEIGALRKLADSIHLRDSIPERELEDLRSRLFEGALENAAYLAAHREHLLPVATRMMQHDVDDYAAELQTRKAQILATAEPIDNEADEESEVLQVPDPHDGWEDFLDELDREPKRRALANWRRRFRRRVESLPANRERFLYALAATGSRTELMALTGLTRKGCYLAHEGLKAAFADLLVQYRAIKAL